MRHSFETKSNDSTETGAPREIQPQSKVGAIGNVIIAASIVLCSDASRSLWFDPDPYGLDTHLDLILQNNHTSYF